MESRETASNELENDEGFKAHRKTLEMEYGVNIVLAQFRSIEPSGKHADEITKISLQEYTAQQELKKAEQKVKIADEEAKAIGILARATKGRLQEDRKSTRLNSSHSQISY